MKKILIILFFLPLIIQAQKPILVPINSGTLVKRDTANGLVAQSPITITSGGSSHVDTVSCATCGSGSGTISGNGTAVRIPIWNSATRITSGLNLNADTTNTRIGFGTTAPTNTITLDSVRSGSGIALYATTDQTTNYNRLRMYVNNLGEMYLTRENAGTGACCSNLYLSSNKATVIAYNGNINTNQLISSGTVQGASTIGTTDVRWDNSRVITANTALKLGNFSTYTASSGQSVNVFIGGTITQTSTAGMTALRIGMLSNTAGSGTYNLIEAGGNSNANGTGTQTNVFTVSSAGKITLDATNTAGGTTGAQTINKPSGTVNFAAAATSLVVTNSLVTTSSIVHAIVRTNDANKTKVYAVVPAAGSFTIYVDAAPAAEISVGFTVIN